MARRAGGAHGGELTSSARRLLQAVSDLPCGSASTGNRPARARPSTARRNPHKAHSWINTTGSPAPRTSYSRVTTSRTAVCMLWCTPPVCMGQAPGPCGRPRSRAGSAGRGTHARGRTVQPTPPPAVTPAPGPAPPLRPGRHPRHRTAAPRPRRPNPRGSNPPTARGLPPIRGGGRRTAHTGVNHGSVMTSQLTERSRPGAGCKAARPCPASVLSVAVAVGAVPKDRSDALPVSAANLWGSGSCWLRTDLVAAGRSWGLLRPFGRREDHVCTHGGDGARPQFAKQAFLHLLALILAERVDGGAVAGAEDDVREAVWPVEVVLASGGHDVRNGGAGEQARKRGRGGDHIPGVERLDQRRLDLAHRLPEAGIGRFEQAWPPGRDGQRAAGADQPPHLCGERGHVRCEEDAEYAHHRIEAAARQPGAGRVAVAELGVV